MNCKVHRQEVGMGMLCALLHTVMRLRTDILTHTISCTHMYRTCSLIRSPLVWPVHAPGECYTRSAI